MEVQNKFSYRPDIDGLRAIAVLVVVFFHAFPKVLTGGFVGVDIFFVISGFLITSIILNDLKKNNFSISHFYSKRIKRIFPSLILVLCSIFLLSWFVLLPDELAQLGKHIAAGSGFIANIVLWKESGYFDTLSELKPLLHLWSLAIEEQFYIVWPFFIILLWRKKKIVPFVIVIVLIISFLISISMLKINPTGAFYSPLSRFWEILLGAALAFFQQNKSTQPKIHPLKHFQSMIGLILIAFAVLTFNEKTAFPGWYALLPAIGTLLIINTPKSSFLNSKILSSRLLVFVGLISYPLYLWHWPLLSIARITNEGTPNNKIIMCILLLSFILSTLTFIIVERPFRLKKSTGIFQWATSFLCLLLLGIGSGGYYAYLKKGIPGRAAVKNIAEAITPWTMELPGTVDCLESFTTVASSFCRKTIKTPNVAILGDSHAGALFSGFVQNPNSDFNQIVVYGSGSCQPSLGYAQERPGCNTQLKTSLMLVAQDPNIKTVVLTSYFRPLIFNNLEVRAKYKTGYSNTFDFLLKNRKNVIVILDTPTLDFSPNICIKRRPYYLTKEYLNSKNLNLDCSYPFEDHKTQRIHYNSFMKDLALKYPQIIFYDPTDIFYKANKIWAILDGNLMYADFNHMNSFGSKKVIAHLIEHLLGNKKKLITK